MIRELLRVKKMMKSLSLIAVLISALTLASCSCLEGMGMGAATQTEIEYGDTPDIPPQSDEFVSFTDTAANYKEFGERTPKDELIVNSGAGSNMASSIPPTIDEEVSDYEEEITITEESDAEVSGASSSSDTYEGEDPVEDWLAEEGQTLKGLLTEWCDRSGWRLIWKTNRNYTLTAGAMFRGRFADVSSALIRAFARARPAPIATFYKGNRVLVIEILEDENAYN